MRKALLWMSIGGALGVAASVAVREATRTPIARMEAPEPPPPPPVLTLPTPPVEPGTSEPPSSSPAPAPRPPAFDFFGFETEGSERAAPPPPAPRVLRFEPLKDRCAAGFDATSTLHDFRGWTKAVGGHVSFERERLEETASAVITVDARTLDTNNPDRDKEMHADFLHSGTFPELRFELKEFRRTSEGAYRMKGRLEIHGTSRDVEIPGTFELRADGYLHAKGELRARMSDFGISPPVTALVIRVDDEIRIWFEIWAAAKGGAP